MSVSVEIVPTADCLAMMGSSHTFTNYSLSGNIVLTYNKSFLNAVLPFFQPSHFTLVQLDVYFEGHQDVIDPKGGMSSVAICRLAEPVVRPGPPASPTIALSAGAACIAVPFDVAVPAWIPPTWTGNDASTSYSLFCKARVQPHYGLMASAHNPSLALSQAMTIDSGNIYPLADDPKRNPVCCGRSLLAPSPRVIEAKPVPIMVGRFRMAPPKDPSLPKAAQNASLFPLAYYTMSPTPADEPAMTGDDAELRLRLFDSLKMQVAVPTYVGVQEKEVPVYVSVMSDLPDDVLVASQLEIVKMELTIEQMEAYQTPVSADYLHGHAIPPALQQPPNLPLLDKTTLSTLASVGLLAPSAGPLTWSRTSQLTPYAIYQNFGWPLAAGRVRTCIPCPINRPVPGTGKPIPFGGRDPDQPTIWPGFTSPHCTLSHVVRMAIECIYQDGKGKMQTETLNGLVPLRFTALATVSQPLPHSPSFRSLRAAKRSAPVPPLPPVPAYAQIYDESGEQRVPDPLPKYEPKRSMEIPGAGRGRRSTEDSSSPRKRSIEVGSASPTKRSIEIQRQRSRSIEASSSASSSPVKKPMELGRKSFERSREDFGQIRRMVREKSLVGETRPPVPVLPPALLGH